jgi:hypothetical protein
MEGRFWSLAVLSVHRHRTFHSFPAHTQTSSKLGVLVQEGEVLYGVPAIGRRLGVLWLLNAFGAQSCQY